jgi:effector-binding domain-containing protein
MLTEPKIVDRSEQPYVAIKSLITMQGFGDVIDRSLQEIFARLEALGVEPAGAPLIRYNVIDMEGELEIEVGVPVADATAGDGHIETGILPAGRYATLTHIGHYDGLIAANAALQDWAVENGLRWAMRETHDGEKWESRLEVYLTDPDTEPDPEKWETQVIYLLADA